MEFERDKAKAQANLQKHGIAFEDAVEIFKDPNMLIFKDARLDYGEPRFIVIAALEMRVHVLECTLRESKMQIISARKANQRERTQYANGQTHH